jgi:hypothetical protein
LSFRGTREAREPGIQIDTQCDYWIPGSLASQAPRNDDLGLAPFSPSLNRKKFFPPLRGFLRGWKAIIKVDGTFV